MAQGAFDSSTARFSLFQSKHGLLCLGIRQGKQVLRLKYLIYQDLRGKLHYQIKEFSYGQGSLLEILRLPIRDKKNISFYSF